MQCSYIDVNVGWKKEVRYKILEAEWADCDTWGVISRTDKRYNQDIREQLGQEDTLVKDTKRQIEMIWTCHEYELW